MVKISADEYFLCVGYDKKSTHILQVIPLLWAQVTAGLNKIWPRHREWFVPTQNTGQKLTNHNVTCIFSPEIIVRNLLAKTQGMLQFHDKLTYLTKWLCDLSDLKKKTFWMFGRFYNGLKSKGKILTGWISTVLWILHHVCQLRENSVWLSVWFGSGT